MFVWKRSLRCQDADQNKDPLLLDMAAVFTPNIHLKHIFIICIEKKHRVEHIFLKEIYLMVLSELFYQIRFLLKQSQNISNVFK